MKFHYRVTLLNFFTKDQTPAEYCPTLLEAINQDPLPEGIHFYEERFAENAYKTLLETPCKEAKGHCVLHLVMDMAEPHTLTQKDKVKRFYYLNKTMDIAPIAVKHIHRITGVGGIYPEHGKDLAQDWTKLSPEAMIKGAFAFYDSDSDDDNESTLSYSPVWNKSKNFKDFDIIDSEKPL